MSNFGAFIRRIGFEEYPFAIFSAEGEQLKLEQLFVKPSIYAPLVDTFCNRSSVIISGERGTGKTALIFELLRNAEIGSLNINIEDFSDLAIEHDQAQLYEFLIAHLAEAIFKELANKPWVVRKQSKDDRLLLSYLLKYSVRGVSLSRIEEKIRDVQIHPIRRAGVWIYERTRGFLNYGANVALAITSDIVRRHFPGLPSIEESEQREYFPALSADKIDDTQLASATYALLQKLTALCKKLGMTRVFFVIDKIDEEPRLENDAERIAAFLRVLLTDNKLLLHADAQFLIACWSIPLEQLKSKVRFQKLSMQRVVWEQGELKDVLNQRLSTFSKGFVVDVEQILDAEASGEFASVLKLANGNPRDLWHLMDAILKKQYLIDSSANRISVDACSGGARDFVAGFNFYEYYPRSSAARSTTMDVYSYIAHLSKLSSDSFTKNQLSEQAGTGSSTNNYVVAMENMGLIRKSDQKGDGGAVVYEIRDPKVTFARNNSIEINRIV